MGGSSAFNPVGHNFLGGGIVGRAVGAGVTGGLSEFTRTNPFGMPINNPLAKVFGNGNGSSDNPNIPGPFSLDPNQVAADQATLRGLGTSQGDAQRKLAQSQYDQFTQDVPTLVANQLKQEMPQIAESANAGHVLDSSAYPQEIARQQAYLTENLMGPAIQQKLAAETGALGTEQGLQTGAAQRGLSLEDFINQANVAKTIGAQSAPQPSSSKAQAGAVMQGVGALAPLAGAFMPHSMVVPAGASVQRGK